MFNFSRWLRQTFCHSARKPHRVACRRRTLLRPQLEQLEARMVLSTWTAVGPAPIAGGQTAGGDTVSGRITGIGTDPLDPNTIYITAAGGGVWKTTSYLSPSPTWTPLTDNLTDLGGNPLPLFMGAIAEREDSHGSQIVYAGTGEANNSVDSFYGNGILVSKDGGSTWTLTNAGGAFTGRTVAKIAIDPSDSSSATAYAAVSQNGTNGTGGNGGIWKTTNFGTTWTNTTGAAGLSKTDDWCDVVVDPSTPTTVYAAQGTAGGAAGNGVYKSTDGGATWALLGSAPKGATADRIALAMFDNGTTSKLLVSVANPATGGLLKMVLSTNGGASFTTLTLPPYLGTQGSYDTTVAIDPAVPSYFYAAGDMSHQGPTFSGSPIESFDSGAHWTDIATDSTGNGPHTDSHAVAFDALGNLLEGDDGGIWRLNAPTDSSGQTWSDLNTNLEITQFTGIAVNPTNAHLAYGGSQDNGTEKYTGGTTWSLVDFGDGGMVRMDPTNPSVVYHTFHGLTLELSTDGGTIWTDITTGMKAGFTNFYPPFTFDSSGNIYYGSDFLNFSSDFGSSWSQIGTPGTNNFNPGSAPLDAVAVSPKDNNVVYVSAGGNMFVTENAHGSDTWTKINLPGGSSTFGQGDYGQDAIAVDPSVATGGTAYAVVPTFTGGGSHVFQTTDFGSTWTDISATLLDTPCNAVAVSSDGKTVYVGTDVGVYFSSNGGSTWAQFGTGMPFAKVTDLEDLPAVHMLAAGTHGRGMFEISDVPPLGSLSIHNPHATEHIGFSGFTLATFTDSQSGVTASSFTATVTWGDGTTSTLSGSAGSIVSLGSGHFALVTGHTYAEEGTKTLSVRVSDSTGDSLSGTTTIAVSDARLTITAVSAPPAGQTEFVSGATFTVATFTDAALGTDVSDFTATVTWGDGTSTRGTVVKTGAGSFAVRTSHAFKDEGSGLSLSVLVTDVGGSFASGRSSTFTVADHPLSGLTIVNPSATEGKGTNLITVATFADINLALPTNFTATITWGDGTTSTVSGSGIVVLGGGNFAIKASHTYAESGSFTLSVQVLDDGGASVSGSRTVSVADAALGSLSVKDPHATHLQSTGTFTVATFHDNNLAAPTSDFTVVIHWGDGTSSTVSALTGGIIAEGNGTFAVLASHLYVSAGTFTLAVTADDVGGASVAGSLTITVS